MAQVIRYGGELREDEREDAHLPQVPESLAKRTGGDAMDPAIFLAMADQLPAASAFVPNAQLEPVCEGLGRALGQTPAGGGDEAGSSSSPASS